MGMAKAHPEAGEWTATTGRSCCLRRWNWPRQWMKESVRLRKEIISYQRQRSLKLQSGVSRSFHPSPLFGIISPPPWVRFFKELKVNLAKKGIVSDATWHTMQEWKMKMQTTSSSRPVTSLASFGLGLAGELKTSDAWRTSGTQNHPRALRRRQLQPLILLFCWEL